MIEQISREFVPSVDNETNACPICRGSDRIEKASSAVRRGTGVIFLPNTGASQPFLSGLAQALSPPAAPKLMTYQDALANTIGSWLIGGIFALLISGVGSIGALGIPAAVGEVALATTLIWFGAVIPLISFARAAREERQARTERPEYEYARSRWENLYYCTRDDVVFLLHEDRVERPERMSDVLFTSPLRG